VNRSILLAGLGGLFIACPAGASPDDPVEALKKNQPPPVAALIDRIVDCNHWMGEPPYDAQRAKEIQRAVSALRCNRLDKDESAILKKHRSDPEVKKAIDAAKRFVQ
jgi:hypothetical protein